MLLEGCAEQAGQEQERELTTLLCLSWQCCLGRVAQAAGLCCARCAPAQVVKKERAVGVVPAEPTIYEVLEELAITVQNQLSSRVPFCAFNGEGGVGCGALTYGWEGGWAFFKGLGVARHIAHIAAGCALMLRRDLAGKRD